MPGNVSNAAPTTVMPWALCRSFTHSREFSVVDNEYKNGESQRSKLSETSRKRWRKTRRIAPAAMQALRAFYDARHGPTEPFYFYDPWDALFTYDPTGAQTLGRYTVRFEGDWSQTNDIARSNVELSLVELA